MVEECAVCGSVKDVKSYHICLWDYGKRICKMRLVCARCIKEDKEFKLAKGKERLGEIKLDLLERGR